MGRAQLAGKTTEIEQIKAAHNLLLHVQIVLAMYVVIQPEKRSYT